MRLWRELEARTSRGVRAAVVKDSKRSVSVRRLPTRGAPPFPDQDAANLLVRAGRFKDATDAWRTGARTLTTEDLEALLDDVAALYGDVFALARRPTR